jgi:hypothetical protein
MEINNSEYLNLLNKYYPKFDCDSINSIADIAIQMGMNRKEVKMIDSEGFTAFIQKVNNLNDENRTFRKMVEKINIKFNSILIEFKSAGSDSEKIAKINRLVHEFEYLIYEFFEEYAELFDWFFEPVSFIYESPEVSARINSIFKCIIGYYKSKYRRIITSDTGLINASCVCGGGN